MLAGTPSIPTMFSHFQSLASGDFGRPDSPVLKLAVPGRTRSVDSLNTLLRDLKHLDLSKHVVVGRPRASGGYADVYEGIFIVQGTNESVKVAIKRFRVFIHEDAGKDLAKVRIFDVAAAHVLKPMYSSLYHEKFAFGQSFRT